MEYPDTLAGCTAERHGAGKLQGQGYSGPMTTSVSQSLERFWKWLTAWNWKAGSQFKTNHLNDLKCRFFSVLIHSNYIRDQVVVPKRTFQGLLGYWASRNFYRSSLVWKIEQTIFLMLKNSNFHEPKRSFQTLLNDVVKSGVFTTLQPGPDFWQENWCEAANSSSKDELWTCENSFGRFFTALV